MIRHLTLALALVPFGATASFAAEGPQPGFEEPGMHSTIAASPNEVRLEFKEAVDPSGTGMTLTDAKGKSVGLDKSHVSPTDPMLLTVGTNQLPDGTYTVTWHATSAKTHAKSKGSYIFKIAK